MICKIYGRKSFPDVAFRSRVPFLSASFRERGNETEGREERKSCRTPKPRATANSQAILRSPRAVREVVDFAGEEERERGGGAGGGGSERSHKAARGKDLHPRTRINIPGETNVTDRSNLHLTGKRCSVSISTDYRSPFVALLRPCSRVFLQPSSENAHRPFGSPTPFSHTRCSRAFPTSLVDNRISLASRIFLNFHLETEMKKITRVFLLKFAPPIFEDPH